MHYENTPIEDRVRRSTVANVNIINDDEYFRKKSIPENLFQYRDNIHNLINNVNTNNDAKLKLHEKKKEKC